MTRVSASFPLKALIAGLLVALAIGGVRAEVMTVGDILQGVITEKERYALGAPVKITFALRNQGARPITYNFSSSKQFDAWVTRAGTEIWRLSRGQAYTMALTSLTLQPNQTQRYYATWNQTDDQGNAVGPGTYVVHAQLTSSSGQPPAVQSQVQIGTSAVALVNLGNIGEAISNARALEGKTVFITATYRGRQPDQNAANTKAGPPVTRNDWVICDSTGCMYVTGATSLNPTSDAGALVSVTGKLQRTDRGQVYLVLTTVRKSGS